MAKYRKKPVVIEAFQWDGQTTGEIPERLPWFLDAMDKLPVEEGSARVDTAGNCYIRTLEGEMAAQEGDWIVRGVKGELYPIKDEIFRATYDEVLE